MTQVKRDLPDLSRTAAAIEAYDAYDAAFQPERMTNDAALAGFAKLDALAEAVGLAFGLDTADRNSVETCRQCIRPGHKVPGPGCERSFVRRMVALWRERSGQ